MILIHNIVITFIITELLYRAVVNNRWSVFILSLFPLLILNDAGNYAWDPQLFSGDSSDEALRYALKWWVGVIEVIIVVVMVRKTR
nr:MAG TPA: hypothetical protein [Caudoviricetes sp.]